MRFPVPPTWLFLIPAAAALAAAALPTLAAPAPSTLRATRLRCEYAASPIGIDAAWPRLGWVLEAPGIRGERQTAYRILVASSEAILKRDRGDLWDSGWVERTESVHIVYGGKPLESGQRVWWKVRVWGVDGKPSAWSEPAWWEMGLLQPADWQASWISHPRPQPQAPGDWYTERPNPLLRKEISLRKRVRSARIYATGLGYYELRLNGEKVGDHVLDPAWTTYSRRVYYSTYDVTRQLRRGANALGVMLGSGWYDPLPLPLFGRFNPREHLPTGKPRALVQLAVTYDDGTREVFGTDESWKAGDGPILKNSVYLGELYDARQEQPGWDRAGFDDRAWTAAVRSTEPLGPLQAQELPPIRVTRTVKSVKVTEPKPGVFIFDLGQNLAGWATLRARGPAGTKVTLRYGELLHKDGMLNPMTSVTGQLKRPRPNAAPGEPPIAWQSDAYILKGSGDEVYTPRFTFHGFRYVEVTGYPGRPPLGAVEGHLLNTDVESDGEFVCSNPMFNRLQDVVRWTQLSNMFSVQSDCPHREKLGYGGDIVAASEMGLLNFDMARFYAKLVHDFADAQRPNGGFTETAPYVGIADESLGDGAGPVGWGTAHPLLLAQLYQYYGNRRLLEEQYEPARRWLQLLRTRAVDGILDNGISDHESLVPKPRPLSGTAFYYLNARLLSGLARVLGKDADARQFAALADEVRAAYNRRFREAGTGKYFTGTQASQAFTLYFGLELPEERDAVLRTLVQDVEARQGHLSTGIFGTKYMLLALSDLGRADVAYTVANQRTFPGWGWMLENGATTLWEHWEFSDNTYSHNHPMFGTVSEWFFKSLAGIQPEPDAVGFDRFVIRPNVVGDLTWAKGTYNSVRGPVASEWRKEGTRLSLTVTIPVGATATVHVPTTDPARVSEGGKLASQSEGVKLLRTEGGRAVYRVDSGTYRFEVR